jgi:hypothetical protein
LQKKGRKKVIGGRISKNLIIDKLDELNPELTFDNISYESLNIDNLDIHDLEIVFQLIPSDTKDRIHLDIYQKTLPFLASQLLKDRRRYRDNLGDDFNIYSLRRNVFKSFAYFILERELKEIDIFLQPFVDSISSTEETASFISELISAEDYQKKQNQFWYVWNKLYPKIKEIGKDQHGYHLKDVIQNYLLAWGWWREGIKDWHSLEKENTSLYANVSRELGHIPSVLYSISKILNSIGSNYTNEGIDWIYTIVQNNRSLQLKDLESNTLYYLEKYLRKFIFVNRQKIKEEIRLKNKVIPILDFMIERGSIRGYLLRESIL